MNAQIKPRLEIPKGVGRRLPEFILKYLYTFIAFDELANCHVCSNSNSWVILVKCGCLGGLSEMSVA
jgi:hypothetical protein